MMTKAEADKLVAMYKLMVAAAITSLDNEARALDSSVSEIQRQLSAETLLLAANMHTGNDESFLNMARRSLALVRTGTVEQ